MRAILLSGPWRLAAIFCLLCFPLPALSQTAEDIPARTLFVVSGGFWQGLPDMEEPADDTAETTEDTDADASDGSEEPRGYFRVVVTRTENNTSEVRLERVAITDGGPEVATSELLDEINSLPSYVTDIRLENSSGISDGEGFEAYIFLKLDPRAVEVDTWTVFVDDFGELLVEPASN